MSRSIAFALFSAFACACGAAPNPARPSTPSPWKPEPVVPAADAEAGRTAPSNADARADNAGDPSTDMPTLPPVTAQPGTTRKADAASEEAPAPPSDLVIAKVAGQSIGARDLLRQWLHQNSIDVLEQLDRLVLSQLVLLEARRLSVRVDEARQEEAFRHAVDAIERQIGERRPGVSLDRYVDQVLGLDPATYREGLRDDALRALLAERVMRAWILQSEHADISVIVVKSEEKAKEVEVALASGDSFADVAKRLSSDASAEGGGRVPPVVRTDTAMGRLAFDTPVGGVGGPMREQGAWLFVHVDSRPTPLAGDWSAIGDAVVASLAERSIEDLELSQWKAAMLRRYQPDITPFLELVGQPVK